jgi:perosamine synthetase
MKVWVNKRIDASSGDLWFGLRACLLPGRNDPTRRVEALWEPSGVGVVGLSVRSLFDLWLSAQDWEAGDRIVFTALTIADMPRIARSHGLEVAAVDIDPLTGEPNLEMLRDLLNHQTRAVVYAHLFGARGDVTGALEIVREAGVQFVEDCAEGYAGLEYRGHPESDLTLFSFGPIKSSTAFGGGLARVKDASVRDRMRLRSALQPEQTRREYAGRILKYGAMLAGSGPRVFPWVAKVLDVVGPGHDVVLQRLTRSFPGPEFFTRIRRRPARPLVLLLERRLREGEAPTLRRIESGQRLLAGLNGVQVPTADAESHAYWVIPVIAPGPDALTRRLAAHGFYATRGRAFAVVEQDPGITAPAPVGAEKLHAASVFLPFGPEMPGPVLDELARIVCDEIAA